MTWTLHHGDCLAGMASLPDKSVDVVITDPPYEAEAHTKGRRLLNGGGDRGAGVRAAPLGFAAITATDRTVAATHFARLARRWIVVFCQTEAAHLWRADLDAAGGWEQDAKYHAVASKRLGETREQLTLDRPRKAKQTTLAGT